MIPVSNKVGNRIRSQVVLKCHEFTLYQINQESNITLSFKPFRAAVAFAEAFTLPILMYLDSGGKYIVTCNLKKAVFVIVCILDLLL